MEEIFQQIYGKPKANKASNNGQPKVHIKTVRLGNRCNNNVVMTSNSKRLCDVVSSHYDIIVSSARGGSSTILSTMQLQI